MSGRRIVMKAIEIKLFGRISDLVFRRFHKAEFQILRCIINPVKISRKFAFGRGDHNSARVSKLFAFFVPFITETDCFGYFVNLALRAGQKMPAAARVLAPVSLQITCFFVFARDPALSFSRASKLIATTSKSSPASNEMPFKVPVKPFKTSLQSIGHS